MHAVWKSAVRTLAIAIALTPTLSAQGTGFDRKFKLRAGLGLTAPKDHLTRKTLGFGLEVGHQSALGRFSVELGYQYKPGDQYREDVRSFPVAVGMPPAEPAFSVDSRKNQVSGLMARVAYGRALSEGLSWHLGVQIGGSKFRQEYIADVADWDWSTYEDTYNGVVSHGTLAASPLVGLSFRLGPQGELEVNLLGLAYTSAQYVHTVGTVAGWGSGHTAKDTVFKEKRMMPHLELAYAIRF